MPYFNFSLQEIGTLSIFWQIEKQERQTIWLASPDFADCNQIYLATYSQLESLSANSLKSTQSGFLH